MSVLAAARLMREQRIGALLVIHEGRLAGIFTERDALFRVIAEGRSPARTRIAEVMTANPRTIAPDRPFGHALHHMHEGGFATCRWWKTAGRSAWCRRATRSRRIFSSSWPSSKREHIGEILG